MSQARAAIVLAAGQGTRMLSATPKVLHAVGGRPMLDWALETARALGCERIVVVTGAHAPEVGAHAARLGADVAIQDPPLGTAHAVGAAKDALADFAGDVVVLYGDTPLIRPESVAALFELRAARGGIAVLGFEAHDPTGYGRLIVTPDGVLLRIVEDKDAKPQEKAVKHCNSGVMAADKAELFTLLAQVKNENAKNEFYLTDVVGLAHAVGIETHATMAPEAEMLGVNSRNDLAAAEASFQARARKVAMAQGATLMDPNSVYFSVDTQLAPDVVVEPHVYFGLGVTVGRGARVCAFSHLEGAAIGEAARIGPFARLRPGAAIGADAHIGNFVEVKNVHVGAGAKANHLSYLGDGVIGARANIGAGTIFCNYDGFDKHQTIVGEDAFIGSNSALVAPVRIGARAYVGSGSVITKDVSEDALALSRARQTELAGWAEAYRARKRAERKS